MALFEKSGLVNESNNMIVKTGISRLESLIWDFLFAMVLSGLMGNVLAGILFEFCYMVLRIFAGGYHASTPGKCLCFTYGSTLCCIVFIFAMPVTDLIFAVWIAVFNGIIFFTAPIESENKPLCNMEKKVYHRNSFIISLAETGLFILLYFAEQYLLAKAVLIAMALVTAGLATEIARKIIKNHFGKGKEIIS